MNEKERIETMNELSRALSKVLEKEVTIFRMNADLGYGELGIASQDEGRVYIDVNIYT